MEVFLGNHLLFYPVTIQGTPVGQSFAEFVGEAMSRSRRRGLGIF